MDPKMPFFPTQTRFNFTQRTIQWISNESSFFYSSNTFITSEHMGTHIDAPYHFSSTGWKVDEIPLKHLISIHALDYGQSKTYPVHQIFAKYNKYGLENLALVDSLLKNIDNDFFTLDIFPIKIGNGTGAPCRIIARIDTTARNTANWFGILLFFFLLFLIGFAVKVIYDFKYNPNKNF
ncbi:unnamed protein product [Rotaria sp. Silwood2]|nr:unnamed protein product [Rotaria sp. Silwood2]